MKVSKKAVLLTVLTGLVTLSVIVGFAVTKKTNPANQNTSSSIAVNSNSSPGSAQKVEQVTGQEANDGETKDAVDTDNVEQED